MHMNNRLAEAQEQWNDPLLFPYVAQHKDHILSRPSYFGVADEYAENSKRIMIVGQEIRDYGSYYDDWPMSDIRQWGIDYLRRQLWSISCEDYKYNRSGFWKLFRCFAKAGYVPCWNNVDKIHQQKAEASTIRLTDDQRRAFCRTYGTDNKSLLCREIEIAKPNVEGDHSIKKRFAIILAPAVCLSLVACSSRDSAQTTQPSCSQQSTESASTSTPQETTEPTQKTQAIETQPQQNICYWCDEMPVGDFETYCVNCRCLKCDHLRKSGGSYLYCSNHNCNESGCEYPAFKDSQYCTEHKCSKPDCENRRWPDSEYCAHHK